MLRVLFRLSFSLYCVDCVENCCCGPCLSSCFECQVKKQTTITSFFKRVTFVVVLKLYPGFVRVPFPYTWLKHGGGDPSVLDANYPPN